MAERENVIDFTVPYYDLVGLTILLKRPEFEYELFKFLVVLDEDVWLCIIASYFLFSGLLYVFDKLSPYSYQNNKHKFENVTPEPRVFTIKEGIWFCMMSLTPQGLSHCHTLQGSYDVTYTSRVIVMSVIPHSSLYTMSLTPQSSLWSHLHLKVHCDVTLNTRFIVMPYASRFIVMSLTPRGLFWCHLHLKIHCDVTYTSRIIVMSLTPQDLLWCHTYTSQFVLLLFTPQGFLWCHTCTSRLWCPTHLKVCQGHSLVKQVHILYQIQIHRELSATMYI